jgi:hypothetical protein
VEDEVGHEENTPVSVNAMELICVMEELAMPVCSNTEDAPDVLRVGHCSVWSMVNLSGGKAAK